MKAYICALQEKTTDLEVGKTYTWSSFKLKKCGIHAYKRMADAILNYKGDYSTLVLLELEILGDVEQNSIFLATNKAKVIRVIPKEEYEGVKFDEKNRLVWREVGKNGRVEYFYDENGNMIYAKGTCEGVKSYEVWKKFDSNNNLVSYKNSDGENYEITIE